MPGIVDDVVDVAEILPEPWRPDYAILKQRVELDVDFARCSLRGSTELMVQPFTKDLREIKLHCRQCNPTMIQVGGMTAKWDYEDAYRRLYMSTQADVHQHGMLKGKIQNSLRPQPLPELTITLPSKLKLQEIPSGAALQAGNVQPSLQRQDSELAAEIQNTGPQFAPIKLTIEFEVDTFRDGLHWIGCNDHDRRYPQVYTKLEPWPGNSSCIFPCLDDMTSRCTWDLIIRCPKTLGDAFSKLAISNQTEQHLQTTDGDVKMADVSTLSAVQSDAKNPNQQYLVDLSAEEAAMELVLLCVGEQTDDVTDPEDESRHTVTYVLNETVTARHIAFAIGPFEHVDLTMFRTPDEEEKLGQTAVKVDGYCLPGRLDELENTCVPVCQAIDNMGVNYGRFPFSRYQILFVDDHIYDTANAAGLSICSTRLLFPQEIIEPMDFNTRILVRAIAEQWSGVNVIPKQPVDTWVTIGIAGYMTDVFMKKLAGNNEYRWQQKLAAEKVYDLDVDRPSIYALGNLLHYDSTIRDFVTLKSALVLGILDRRLVKSSGSTGVTRIISKIFLNAKTGSLNNSEISTQDFQKTCERLGHNKLESFFKQWVMGAGAPIFYITQKFNKKKLVVELTISQRQDERATKPEFAPRNFMREVKEDVDKIYAEPTQTVFTGPMTIRIHEADGTPYEHIVEVKEKITRLEIPYNTKYKRLKRSRRQKERAIAEGHAHGETGDDALLYCLGDILDTPEDAREWNLTEWTPEDEEKMGQESYEWIRMDADFEWIGYFHLIQPLYMYISQLQQDRDLVAQFQSIKYLCGSSGHHMSLTILVKTLMDSRYFHGIRVMAADGIAQLAKDRLQEVGQHMLEKAFAEMFCDEGTVMPRPNDFSSRETFILQCAIPRAMAKLRDPDDKVPMTVQQFFVDKLKFNDNSDNAYSDCHYIATLMNCLADSLVVSHRKPQPSYQFNFDEEEPMEPEDPVAEFEKIAIHEIERYRRIDEWILTYQNVYSTAAIDCLLKLTKAKIVKDKSKELLQYTLPGTADNVRLAAFRCLNEVGLTRRMPVMRHLIHSIADDSSPYFRERLLRLLGEAIGHIALHDSKEDTKQSQQSAPTDGLVLEQEASTEEMRIEATRNKTPEGALEALKLALQHDAMFKKALWYAATSPLISLTEVGLFCDIAALLFEAVISHHIVLKLPRLYKCQHQGKATVRFFRSGPYRTVPRDGLTHDDWQAMQDHGLRYSGPLSTEAKKVQAAEKLMHKLAETQRQLESAQAMSQNDMPPPPLMTPSAERTGIKLTLGAGMKRKASVDLGQREDPPKTIKISKTPTPTGLLVHPSVKKTPIPSVGKLPTPNSKVNGGVKRSLIVALPVQAHYASRIKSILSQPPRHAKTSLSPNHTSQRKGSQAVKSSFSGISQHSPSFPEPKRIILSPSSGTSALFSPPSLQVTTPSPSLNLGGFRSFGPAPDPKPVPQPIQSPIENKSQSIDEDTSSPHDSGDVELTPAADVLEPPAKSPSFTLPKQEPSMDSPAAMDSLQPPKKKLLLKLTSKSSHGSPE